MQSEDNNDSRSHGYCCSNPNCRSFFTHPRIISYIVCPVCQTLVSKIPAVLQAETVREDLPQPETTKEKKNLEELEQSPFQKRIGVEQHETVEPKKSVAEAETISPPNATEAETRVQIEGSETEKTESRITLQPRIPEMELPEKKIVLEPAVQASEDKAQSRLKCQYYFGYLREREKGKAIPSSCLECAKCLDCLLFGHYSTEDIVEEIKKWYQ